MSLGGVSAGLGILQAIQGIGAQKHAQKAGDAQLAGAKLSAAQMRALVDKYITPVMDLQKGQYGDLAGGVAGLGKKALAMGNTYDPAVTSDAALRSYDMASNAGLKRDVNNITLPLALRGLKDSSETGGGVSSLLTRRSAARGQYAADLRLDEPNRALGVMGAAAGIGSPIMQQFNPAATAQGAAGILGGSAQTQSNLASTMYGQVAGIDPFASLRNINWNWMKMRSGGGGSGGGFSPRSPSSS